MIVVVGNSRESGEVVEIGVHVETGVVVLQILIQWIRCTLTPELLRFQWLLGLLGILELGLVYLWIWFIEIIIIIPIVDRCIIIIVIVIIIIIIIISIMIVSSSGVIRMVSLECLVDKWVGWWVLECGLCG